MANDDTLPDPIEAAIAAVDAEPVGRRITMVEVPIVMRPDGRPAVLHCPVDLTDVEVIELAGFILGGLRPHIAKYAQPGAGSLWVPGGPT